MQTRIDRQTLAENGELDTRYPSHLNRRMLVEELGRESAREWDDYVAAHPHATLYHSRVWREAGMRAYRLRAPFLIARKDHRVCGVLPLFLVRNPSGGYATSGLFGAYGRVLADDAAAGKALLDGARARAAQARVAYLVLKGLAEEPFASEFVCRDFCVIAKMALPGDPQVLWKGFRDKIRNSIRKAQKSDLKLFTGPEQLQCFYDVLAENMHRKGTPIYGTEFMRVLCEALGENAEVFTLWRDGRAISGALVCYHKGTVYVPFASSRPEAFRFNPNNLIYWEIMQRACRLGMHTFDFGRSPRDSSTLAFKLGWGATITAQPFFVQTLKGAPPTFDVNTPGMQRLVRLWQHLPRPIADALGPSICRRYIA
jgi:FemAB-related protein (PEP-CTERM system-associated)